MYVNNSDFYSQCYEKIISPVIKEYRKTYYGICEHPNTKDLIRTNYEKFVRHCREEYMDNQEEPIDRHKVSACYIYAVLKSHVLSCCLSHETGDKTDIYVNERLALCLGMSILRAYVCSKAKQLKNEETKSTILELFKGELKFPKTNHGDYKQNLIQQLYYTRKENNYNILALANTMFMLEVYNLQLKQIDADVFKS